MTKESTFRSGHRSPVRYVLLLIGFSLAGWSLSDDYLVGGGPGFGMFQLGMLGIGIGCVVSAFLGRAIATGALVTVVTLLLSLAAGELLLRMAVPEKFAAVYELDERYIYRLRPGVVREYTHQPVNGGGSHLYRTNSDGYRGEELHPSGNDLRIVVYGDSFIHAIYTELNNTFTERLEGELERTWQQGVEVINAGVAGYGTDQALRRIEDELAELKPDLLVVGIYTGNDFGDLVRNKLYRLDEQSNLVGWRYELAPDIEYSARLSVEEMLLRKLIRSAIAGATSGPVTRDPAEAIRMALTQQINEFEEYEAHDNVVRELRSDPYSADISLNPESASARLKSAMMAAIMRAIQQQANRYGTPVVFLAIPSPIDVTRGNHEAGVIDRNEFPDYDPDRLTGTIMGICGDNGFQCFNLMATMRTEGGRDLFLKGGDDHWNDPGQAVAARAFAAFLHSAGLVPPAPGTSK